MKKMKKQRKTILENEVNVVEPVDYQINFPRVPLNLSFEDRKFITQLLGSEDNLLGNSPISRLKSASYDGDNLIVLATNTKNTFLGDLETYYELNKSTNELNVFSGAYLEENVGLNMLTFCTYLLTPRMRRIKQNIGEFEKKVRTQLIKNQKEVQDKIPLYDRSLKDVEAETGQRFVILDEVNDGRPLEATNLFKLQYDAYNLGVNALIHCQKEVRHTNFIDDKVYHPEPGHPFAPHHTYSGLPIKLVSKQGGK